MQTRRLLPWKREVQVVVGVGGHVLKDLIARAPFTEIGSGGAADGHALGNHGGPDEDELAGIFVGYRLQQNRVDDGEDGGVCADSEREGEHCDSGEGFVLGEGARAVA